MSFSILCLNAHVFCTASAVNSVYFSCAWWAWGCMLFLYYTWQLPVLKYRKMKERGQAKCRIISFQPTIIHYYILNHTARTENTLVESESSWNLLICCVQVSCSWMNISGVCGHISQPSGSDSSSFENLGTL